MQTWRSLLLGKGEQRSHCKECRVRNIGVVEEVYYFDCLPEYGQAEGGKVCSVRHIGCFLYIFS